MTPPRVELFASDEAASRAGAESFVACAERAITLHGRFAVALSGGDTPRAMYRMLAGPDLCERVDWSRVHLFWGDDRAVPPDHPRSNFGMAKEALIRSVPIPADNIHRIRGELDARAAADAYARELRDHFGDGPPIFDLVHLGVGEDGHTASLFPGDPALDECERTVIATVDRTRNEPRVTLTVPLLLAARRIEVLVLEAEKAEVVRAILACEQRPAELPAAVLADARGEVVWLLSRAAASRLPEALT
jgi:6-phosphogluconolactonase